MLQKLNERIQGIIAWVIIVLITFTFALFGVDYYMQSHQASTTEVEVNGHPISKQFFEINYRRARQQRDPSLFTATDERLLKHNVLENLITNEIILQSVKTNGFTISPEQANIAILNIPQFQEDGHFSAERYQQALSGAMYTSESFQNEVSKGMLLNQQRFTFIGSAFVLSDEVKQFVKLYQQTRDYAYLEIPKSLLTQPHVIPESVAYAYYKKHLQEFLSPEQVSIDFIRLSLPQLKNNIKVKEEEIEKSYQDNKNSFLRPAQWQVAHILFAIPSNQAKARAEKAYNELQHSPNKFDELVKLSDDKLSISKNGVLPWFSAGQTNLDKVLLNLTKPGEISAPIKTAQGYEIFKVIAYKPAMIDPYANVKKQIKEQLETERVQAVYSEALEQLGDLAYQSPDSLVPTATALHLAIEHSKPFSRQGGDESLTQQKQVINTAFSRDVLKEGNNSEPIQLDSENVIVLRVNKHIPSMTKPFSTVKNLIDQKLIQQEAENGVKQIGEQLLSSQEQEKQQLMNKYQLHWKSVNNASREGKKIDNTLNEIAFNLSQPGSQEGQMLENGSYIIVHLKAIHDGQWDSLNKEQRAMFTQQLESSEGVMDYELYLKHLMTTAKIKRS